MFTVCSHSRRELVGKDQGAEDTVVQCGVVCYGMVCSGSGGGVVHYGMVWC